MGWRALKGICWNILPIVGAFKMARNPPISPMRFAVSTAFISGQLPRGKDGKVTAGNVQDHIPRAQQLSRLWLRLMPW
jgi:enamine deaminase RidA (YjgF/YER057c/UK114 family)